ncbi:MAG TPA: VWA domain-containing protein [Pyrinomonadaceae bacterium]|nr:VWA domain-containing protein [Pyrinomonadaceae bacterium]
MNNRLLLTVVLLFSLLTNSLAQQPVQPATPSPAPERPTATQQQSEPREDDPDVVRITANLVQIDAVVTKDGKHVTDLKPEDFEILEDGKPQTITQFSYVSNVPAASTAIAKPPASRPADPLAPVVPVKVRPNETRRTVVLLVDDLGISAENVVHVKQQLRTFLDKQLQPNDLVSIVTTGGKEVGALQQFTTDKRILSSAVDRLRWHPCSRGGSNVFAGRRPQICAMDAKRRTLQVLRFVLQGMRDLPGRKSMVVFSGSLPYESQEGPLAGFDAPGMEQLDDLLPPVKSDDPGIGDQLGPQNSASAMVQALQHIAELAIRASVVIYGVDTRGLQPTAMQAVDEPFRGPQHVRDQRMTRSLAGRSAFLVDGREGLRLLSSETGGFTVFNSNDFQLGRVMEDQAGYYLIGYRPSDETFNRRFHHIRVRAKRSGVEVRTRKGFYGFSESEATAPVLSARDNLNKALMSPFGANDVNVRLTTIYADDPAKGSVLRSLLFLNAQDLVFTHLPDGMHEAKFDLSSALFGDYGKVVSRQDEKVTLRLKQARYEQVMREGVVYKFDRPAGTPGNFQFRVALHDPASSRIGAAGQFIQVPNLRAGRLAVSGILVGGVGGAAEQLRSGPAVRQFQQGAGLNLVYLIYNAATDPATPLPRLTAQTRIFRDGEVVYTGKVAPIDLTGQTDLKRIAAGAQLELGSTLTPGDYVLQVIVEDQLAKEKDRTVTQWIDFAIVK